MPYPYSYHNGSDVEVTKREMFVSALFVLLALIAGICIAGSIRSCEDDENVKYYEAVQISDSTQFNYAFKTNAGHTLAYGTVEAVGMLSRKPRRPLHLMTRLNYLKAQSLPLKMSFISRAVPVLPTSVRMTQQLSICK